MTHHIDIDSLVLYSGSHTAGPPPGTPGCKMCLFEAYNAIITPPDAPQQITDERPPDMSPVLHRMGMRLNDALPDDKRQKLKRFLPRGGHSPLAGTSDDGLDGQRGWLATDWVLRTATPLWLDAADQPEWASRLRELGPTTDQDSYDAAWSVAREIRDEARTLRGERLKKLRTKALAAAAAAVDAAAAAAAAVAVAAVDAAAAAVDAAAAAAAAVAVAAVDAAAAAAGGDAAAAVAAAAAAIDAAAAATGAAAVADKGELVWVAVAAGGELGSAGERATYQQRYGPTIAAVQDSAIDLYTRLVNPAKETADAH